MKTRALDPSLKVRGLWPVLLVASRVPWGLWPVLRHRTCNLQAATLQPLMSGMHDELTMVCRLTQHRLPLHGHRAARPNLWAAAKLVAQHAQILQRVEVANALREAAELVVCKVQNA